MRRVPLPLLVVLCVAAVQTLAWSVLVPAFQGPDEVEHYSYAQRIAETGKPTWTAVEDLPSGSGISVESEMALRYGDLRALIGNVGMRPIGEEIDEDEWERVDAKLTDADKVPTTYNAAFRNPPAYYAYEAVAYLPFSGADLFTREYVLRWATLPFFLIAVVMAWLLAGEVFGRRRWLQTVTALFVALQPLLAQLGGFVNPDAMVAAVFGVALWLAAVIVNRGITWPRVAGAVATSAVGLLTHGRAAPVVLIFAAAFAVRALRAASADRRRLALTAGGVLAGAAAVVAASAWYAVRGDVSVARVREFGSYVWQFYLPKPGFMKETVRADWDVRDVYVDRLWSGFLTHDVVLSPGLLDTISLATMIGAVIVLLTFAWRCDAVRRRLGLAFVFAVAVLGVLLTIHAAAWRDLAESGNPVITGRYLTPLLPLAGLAIAAVAGSLPRRIGPGVATAVLGLEALLALGALGAAVVRFHA